MPDQSQAAQESGVKRQRLANFLVTRKFLAATSLAASLFLVCTVARAGGYEPADGFVPDTTTAARIAKDVLIPIYGSKVVEAEMPFKVELRNGIWTVTGVRSAGSVGGVATVKIAKIDGRVLYVMHSK